MKGLIYACILRVFGQTPIRRITFPDGVTMDYLERGVFPAGRVDWSPGSIVFSAGAQVAKVMVGVPLCAHRGVQYPESLNLDVRGGDDSKA